MLYAKIYPQYLRLEKLPFIGRILHAQRHWVRHLLFYYLQFRLRWTFEERIRIILSSPDNQYIPRVPHAGQIVDDYLVMHNGLKINPESYYSEGFCWLLVENCGVHEPQEERAFMEVLKCMHDEAVIIELGAYWGFYSMWFHQQVKRPHCYLVEPEEENLRYGRDNFAANHMQGQFFRAFVGREVTKTDAGVPVIAVDNFIAEHNLERVNILHSDIQGAELDMLLGAQRALADGRVDYVFISTHTNELHAQCLAFLTQRRFTILAEANLDESYSYDGVIVARRSGIDYPAPIAISKRQPSVTPTSHP